MRAFTFTFTAALCVLLFASITTATDLTFSFSANPTPLAPYPGTVANTDAFDPGSTYYGSYITDANPYGTWVWHDYGGGNWDWVNPLTQHSDGGVGWTPDIAVIFPAGSILERIYLDPAYGDLVGVMYVQSSASGQAWPLSLSDDNSIAGINPVLHSFDLAYFGGGTLASVQVQSYDGVNLTTLWSTSNVAIPSNGHVSFDFGGVPIEGMEESLWISYTTQAGQPIYNVALDNVVFSQTPEPTTLLLMLAMSGIAFWRRR